jgi:hypothetical protein
MNNETAKQLVFRVVGYTVGFFLAISCVQWMVSLGVFIMGLTSVFSANKQQTVKLIPGLLIVFVSVTMMLLLVVLNSRFPDDHDLLHKLRPWYVSVMIGMWGLTMFSAYRKWRLTNSEK